MTTTLTATPEFLALLPWAKSMAQASGAAELDIDHFRQAAVFCHLSGVVPLPEALYNALKQQMASFPAFKAQPEPVLHKMPLTSALKFNLGSNQAMGCFEWLNTLALDSEAEADTPEVEGLKPSKAEPDTLHATAFPSAPLAAAAMPGDLGPGWNELKPWVHGAMQAHSVDELTVPALALGLLMALEADALDQHHGLAHWGRGHADELVFWLEQLNQYHKAMEPVFTDSLIAPGADLQSALMRLDGDTYAPTLLWRWLQSAVSEANRYSRLLQVAYHEAGHAVAAHLLVPESTVVRATIVPNGNAGGYVLRTFNEDFGSVYRDSLEFLREHIVVSLAGRAAEEKRYGKGRADSGANDDMAKASIMAWTAITSIGLDDVYGPVNLMVLQKASSATDGRLVNVGKLSWLQTHAEQRLQVWLKWGMAEARRLVDAHWPLVELVTRELMSRKTLENQDLKTVLGSSLVEFQLTEIPA